MNPFDFTPENFRNTPDITQRTIIAAARERLVGLAVQGDFVDIPVEQPFNLLSEEMAALGPQVWHNPGHYIVTFRRIGGEWQPIAIK